MNDWGIPDWRDAAAYGDVTRWTFNRWRWEFYRRRDDLRAYFDARAEETYQHWQRYAGKPGFPAAHLRPDEPGFCAMVDDEALKRFSYPALPNPRIGDQPEMTIWPNEHDGAGSYIEGDSAGKSGFRGTFGELLDLCDVTLTDEQRVMLRHALGSRPTPLEAGEMAVIFDLHRALEPQLAHAREMLRWHQSDIHGKPLQKRRHPAKRLGYLRTLDAREAGASWAEIAELHPNTAKTEQTARDIWDAANALRFNF
jgi:hypothetical protein